MKPRSHFGIGALFASMAALMVLDLGTWVMEWSDNGPLFALAAIGVTWKATGPCLFFFLEIARDLAILSFGSDEVRREAFDGAKS